MPENETLIPKIREAVKKRYEADTTPLLLSELGGILKHEGIWAAEQAEGRKLRQVIEAAQDPDLLIVRDQNSPAYVAVTTAATKELVLQHIQRRGQTRTNIPDLEALPRAVLLAFCVRQDANKPVFLRRLPPFRYEVGEPSGEDRETFVLIDERYRRPGLKLINIADLSASDRLDLQAKIATWSRDKDIDIAEFYKPTMKKRTNALERLLAAQPAGLAEKIMIPADIALILSEHE